MLYKKKKWTAIIFLLPFVAFAGLFLIYPFVYNLVGMFQKFEYRGDPNPAWCSGDNFSNLFKDSRFLPSIGNTFVLIAFVIVFQMGIALILALLVNSLKRGANIFRVIFFIPIILSGTTIGTMFLLLSGETVLDPSTGFFNQILAAFGIHHGTFLPRSWFPALSFVMLPIIWQYIGFYFVILLTGLTNISDDIMEAAALDGADGFKRVWYVTMPMLQNVFRTCMVLAITGALKVYDVPAIVAPGGRPSDLTYFMGTFAQYLSTISGGLRSGEACVYSTLLVLVGVVVSQASNFAFKENKDI